MIDIASCRVYVTKGQCGVAEPEGSHELSALTSEELCRGLAMVLRRSRVTGGQRRHYGAEMGVTLEKLADLASALDAVFGRSAGSVDLTEIRQYLCLPRPAAGHP